MSDLTLAEFLAARLDEDEAEALAAGGATEAVDWRPSSGNPDWDYQAFRSHIARHDPARVLRETGAGRKILELHLPGEPDEYGRIRCQRCDESGYPCSTLRAQGAVFSDHPAYRDEWRP